jgi:hypothetical protein
MIFNLDETGLSDSGEGKTKSVLTGESAVELTSRSRHSPSDICMLHFCIW